MRKTIAKIALFVVIIMGLSVFFFFKTIQLSKPTTMHLVAGSETTATPASRNPNEMVTLLLFNDNTVYAYQGKDMQTGHVLYEKDSSLNKYLQTVKHTIADTALVVVIKPEAKATYQNTVSALNEMANNDIKRYVLNEITAAEQKFIDRLRKG